MVLGRIGMACLLLWLPGILSAGGNAGSSEAPEVRLIKSGDKTGTLRLEAWQAPLEQIFNVIASETGVRLHYPDLPRSPVTATCIGTTVTQVMECLLGPEADLIFRSAYGVPEVGPGNRPAELWILKTSIASYRLPAGGGDSGSCTTDGTQCGRTDAANARTDVTQDGQDETGQLLVAAHSQDAAQRADAIARLAAEGRDEAAVREALEAALADENADVRAQAVAGLAHGEGSAAAAVLQEAMHDRDASVRLMAVDHAGNDAALLQQALDDSDETVRSFAATKLAELAKTRNAQ
jgi:hypothetical protein